MANKHMKKYSTTLAIREIETKTTLRFHFTHVRMAIIKKTSNNKCQQRCGVVEEREGGTLFHCW
jgi:GMP synthase PP-ATPase subunit